MSKEAVIQILLGLISFISLAGVAILGWLAVGIHTAVGNHNAKMIAFEIRLTQLAADKDLDVAQNQRLVKLEASKAQFWELHGWSKDQHNEARADADKPLAKWPDLHTHPHD